MEQLTARITADAIVKTLEGGRKVVNFNVAKNRSYKTKSGERKTDTKFYQCSYWLTDKVAPFLTKGQLVELYGDIRATAYEGRDGKPHAALQMHISQIEFISAKPKVARAAKEKPGADKEQSDDLPF